MKAISNTTDELIVRHRPWVLSSLTAALALATTYAAITGNKVEWTERTLVAALAVGITLIWWHFFPFTSTRFSRFEGLVEHCEGRVTGQRCQTWPLDHIERAAIEIDWRESARLSRVVLISQDDSFPLERGYGSQDREAIRDTINEWLDSN